METKILTWQDKKEAIALLKKGEVVLFPTETVYGIACLASSYEASERMREAKNRPAAKPFTLMCSSTGQVAKYCECDCASSSLMLRFMPGEVTFLLKGRKGTPKQIDLGTGVIGVRVPADDNVLELIEETGEPLLVSSANLSGQAPALDFDQAKATFFGRVAAIIEGHCVSSVPSTILDLVHLEENGAPKLIRQGNVEYGLMADVYRNSKKTIAIGCDHGGYAYKEAIKEHLLAKGYVVLDNGCADTKSVDYPEYGRKVGEEVANKTADLGVVVCTSGIGISIAANKVAGVRCGLAYDDVVTMKMREHNDANVIAFGQKYMDLDDVLRRVDIFLTQGFSPLEKHRRRVGQLEK